jgi:hypothetical protein
MFPGNVVRGLAWGAVVWLAGCGGGGSAGTSGVTGTVTYKGQPVKEVTVTFTPATGRSARGVTDAQGKFSLSTFKTDDGAVPGSHKVTITGGPGAKPPPMPGTPEAANYKPEPLAFPAKYSDPRQSDLTANVEKGKKNDFKFELND